MLYCMERKQEQQGGTAQARDGLAHILILITHYCISDMIRTLLHYYYYVQYHTVALLYRVLYRDYSLHVYTVISNSHSGLSSGLLLRPPLS